MNFSLKKAPEVWNKDYLISLKADIYSFGITLAEMFGGCLPTLSELKQNADNIKLKFKINDDAPSCIYDLIIICLNADPGMRKDCRRVKLFFFIKIMNFFIL